MILRKSLLLVPGLLLVTGCQSLQYDSGQYWQRVSPSEQVYQQGPKADQMLDRDIGRCNTEVKELKSLGVVNDPILTDPKGRVLETDELPKKHPNYKNVPKYDITAPPNDRTFHTFDECMYTKGWERVMKLPHKVKPSVN
jgi:hypothetical protein